MRKTVTLLLALIFFTGCHSNVNERTLGEMYYEKSPINSYTLVLENGQIYRSFPEAETHWIPNTVYNDEIGKAIARCDYNGTTYVYTTSSPNCVYIENKKQSLKPKEYLFSDEILQLEVNGTSVSEIELKLYTDDDKAFSSRETIVNETVIEDFFHHVLDENNYVKIPISSYPEVVDNIGYFSFKCKQDPELKANYKLFQSRDGTAYILLGRLYDEHVYIFAEINDLISSYNWILHRSSGSN